MGGNTPIGHPCIQVRGPGGFAVVKGAIHFVRGCGPPSHDISVRSGRPFGWVEFSLRSHGGKPGVLSPPVEIMEIQHIVRVDGNGLTLRETAAPTPNPNRHLVEGQGEGLHRRLGIGGRILFNQLVPGLKNMIWPLF